MRVGDRIVGVHSLSDKVPIKQDGFDADEAAFRGRSRISEWVFAFSGPPQAASAPAPR